MITGGLGGLGLQLANWLIQQGAKQIVLVSRNAPTAAAQSSIDTLRESANVIVKQADVSDRSQLATVLSEIKFLRGVIHAAGVLDDGLLMQLDGNRFNRVLAPKVQGAWNLHELTQDRSLDFFVLFSSAASLLGSPGQANHVAANAFLDALAHHRQAIGLPALSINWGVWSEIGSATGQQNRLRSRGVRAIAPATGLQIFGQLLRQNRAQVGVIPIDWSKFIDRVDAPFFADFRSIAQPLVQRRPASMLTYLQTEVAKVIGLPSAQLPSPQQGFFDLGMDSLMTVELKNRLETNLGVSLTATAIFEHPTIRDLAQHLTTLIDAPPDNPPNAPTQPPDPPAQPPETAILAELEELETLLRQR
ncbi:MAG: SDR family NAD(P)-dependent oxidoreductase [Leptolyngbyaceae cyanobacterium SM1_3_5]|nr:SDR family NAD(P)-dependent oxidoreductase [Leptolyngbyaceae cyanobacterium SM1_3_5]